MAGTTQVCTRTSDEQSQQLGLRHTPYKCNDK